MSRFLLFSYSLFWGFIFCQLSFHGYLGQKTKAYVIYLVEIKFFTKFAFYVCLISLISLGLMFIVDPLWAIYNVSDHTYIDGSFFASEGGGATGSNNIPSMGNASVTVTDNNVNINTPHINIYLSQKAVQAITNAGTSAAGIRAGVKLAFTLAGPAGKVFAMVGTLSFSHAASMTAKRVESLISPDSSKTGGNDSTTNNYVSNYLSENPAKASTDPNSPLILLPDLDTYANFELMFLFFILNSALSTFLISKNINLSKYIPNNKVGKFLEFLLARYIKIWYTSNIFVFTLSWICLLVCVLISKGCLYLILHI